jgi:hypothetical protein
MPKAKERKNEKSEKSENRAKAMGKGTSNAAA